jgi:hypothetical protein
MSQLKMEFGQMYKIVERPGSILGLAVVHHSGLTVVAVHHPVMAQMVLDVMNEHGEIVDADGRRLVDSADIQRLINRLFLSVPCPQCKALKGQGCVRPSGHQTYHEQPHTPRAEAFDVWLDERRGAQ